MYRAFKKHTGLELKSLIEKVGFRQICEIAFENNKIYEELDEVTFLTEPVIIFLDRFYGLDFKDNYELIQQEFYDKYVGGNFKKYIAKVQEEIHLL